jgi:hypothetical protein
MKEAGLSACLFFKMIFSMDNCKFYLKKDYCYIWIERAKACRLTANISDMEGNIRLTKNASISGTCCFHLELEIECLEAGIYEINVYQNTSLLLKEHFTINN